MQSKRGIGELLMNKDAELKPCPFCGGKARLMTYDTYGSHYVKCDNVSCGIVTWIHTTGEEAVEAWNKMVTDEEYVESMYTRKEYGE